MTRLKANHHFFISLLIGFSLIFSSCSSSNEEEKPSLSFSKMSEVLADVHIMEGELQGINVAEKDSLASLYYYTVFKHHNIKEEDFYQSLNYYSKRPELYEQLYVATGDTISNKKGMY